jgi:O-acetyl-ADP-ribose deacetylase (regulator of RNase III)
MITYIKDDIFKAHVHALVNPVNCVGVMGAGLAKQFKSKYPLMFTDYCDYCKKKELNFGNLHVYKIPYEYSLLSSLNKAFDDVTFVPLPIYIINFPTKYHWRENSKLENVELGLKALKLKISELAIKSIALPMLGCGYGGLKQLDVKRLIESNLKLDNVGVLVYNI